MSPRGRSVQLRARETWETVADLLPPEAIDSAVLLERYVDVRDRDLRGRQRRFVVESERCVRRFLRSDAGPCESLLLTPVRLGAIGELVGRHAPDSTLFVADEATMTALVGYRQHGGVLAMGVRGWHPPPAADALRSIAATGPVALVVAERVVQVDNVGTLFRNAACFGAAGVLLDDACADPLLRKTIRFSTGHVFDVAWGQSRDLASDLDRLRALDILTVAVEQDERSRPLRDLPRRDRVALVLGNEASGLSAAARAACDAIVRIPSLPADEDGRERSLNVGVASAVALYEWRRLRD